MIEAAEFADDGREGGRDDGLIEGGEEEPQHQPGQDDQDLAMGHLGRLLVDVGHESLFEIGRLDRRFARRGCARSDENRSNRSTKASRSDRVQLENTFESTRRLSLSRRSIVSLPDP